jgi:hypothetical protein
MTEAIQITVSSEMANRMDESNSTKPRPAPATDRLSISAVLALTRDQPPWWHSSHKRLSLPKKTGLSPRKARLVMIVVPGGCPAQ